MKILVVGAAGYIGSRISYELILNGYDVIGCDVAQPIKDLRFATFFPKRYQKLSDADLLDIDLVLWFAGHSTVGMSIENPEDCVDNNVLELLGFSRLLKEREIPMLYASSASILSTTEEKYSLVSNEERSNIYDSSKLAYDVVSKSLGHNVLGLRLGTVAGWSPQMRWDTLFNSMNRAAKFDGVVRASNCSNFRGVLFIEDLLAYIQKEIDQIRANNKIMTAKQVGLASWSGSIGTMASSIASFWNVPIEFGGGSGTYSFVVSDRELKSALAENELYLSIADRCERFKRQNDW